MIGSLGQLYAMETGIRIIQDPHAYSVKWEVHGLADAHKPNRKKMLYRRRKVIIPRAYFAPSKRILVIHPTLLPKLKADMEKWNNEHPRSNIAQNLGSTRSHPDMVASTSLALMALWRQGQTGPAIPPLTTSGS